LALSSSQVRLGLLVFLLGRNKPFWVLLSLAQAITPQSFQRLFCSLACLVYWVWHLATVFSGKRHNASSGHVELSRKLVNTLGLWLHLWLWWLTLCAREAAHLCLLTGLLCLRLQFLLRLLLQGSHHGRRLALLAAHLPELVHSFLRSCAVLFVGHNLEGQHLLKVRRQAGFGLLFFLDALL
jgi:hypothetical protein